MPKELHDKLERQGKKIGLKGKRLSAYIFGTLYKIKNDKNKRK